MNSHEACVRCAASGAQAQARAEVRAPRGDLNLSDDCASSSWMLWHTLWSLQQRGSKTRIEDESGVNSTWEPLGLQSRTRIDGYRSGGSIVCRDL